MPHAANHDFDCYIQFDDFGQPNPSRDRQATTTQAMHGPSGGMPALGSQASKFASWHLDKISQDRNILPLTSLQKRWHPLSDPLGGSS
jgi:hypothetical protein